MLRTIEKREAVRAVHSTWLGETDMSSKYRRCTTLDPTFAEDAWESLSEDSFPLEIANLPAILHRAFISELSKRVRHGRR